VLDEKRVNALNRFSYKQGCGLSRVSRDSPQIVGEIDWLAAD